MFKEHPKGLYILFFTEMWERFSYYGMRAILVLYIYSTAESNGLGWTKADALWLYGWYTMLVYVMSIPGGILADKFIGQKKAVMLGGLILVVGHGVLAVDAMWAFYTGLALIILGVGTLKPNISTMVGGLYPPGDERRDKGFTIFYIGINVGAFLSSITVALVANEWGWHYGFGLAGFGMALGQIVFIMGQKHLKGIGDFTKQATDLAIVEATKRPLTKIEKDRVIVLLISFLIIIVFWGAFEQAGGLLNIYTDEKIDRFVFGWEVPAGVFQSVNAFFIMVFGTAVAAYWVNRGHKNKETSSLFKMAIGTMIMGLGFLCMSFASLETGAEAFGKAGLYWLVLAYLFHTIGELCASPVALSFITKLAPVKYASIMMGLYFAATGLGNKLAGNIGEAATTEPVNIEYIAGTTANLSASILSSINEDKSFQVKAQIYVLGDEIMVETLNDNRSLNPIFKFEKAEGKGEILAQLREGGATKDSPYHALLRFEKDGEAKKIKANKGDGMNYSGPLDVVEISNEAEFNIFTFIFAFTIAFGILLLLFLKRLKILTHGAEDVIETKTA